MYVSGHGPAGKLSRLRGRSVEPQLVRATDMGSYLATLFDPVSAGTPTAPGGHYSRISPDDLYRPSMKARGVKLSSGPKVVERVAWDLVWARTQRVLDEIGTKTDDPNSQLWLAGPGFLLTKPAEPAKPTIVYAREIDENNVPLPRFSAVAIYPSPPGLSEDEINDGLPEPEDFGKKWDRTNWAEWAKGEGFGRDWPVTVAGVLAVEIDPLQLPAEVHQAFRCGHGVAELSGDRRDDMPTPKAFTIARIKAEESARALIEDVPLLGSKILPADPGRVKQTIDQRELNRAIDGMRAWLRDGQTTRVRGMKLPGTGAQPRQQPTDSVVFKPIRTQRY